MTLWGDPDRIRVQNMEQLHAYDCHQNVTEPQGPHYFMERNGTPYNFTERNGLNRLHAEENEGLVCL